MSKLDAEQNTTSNASPPRTAREESLGDFSPQWCQTILKDPSYQHSDPKTRIVGGPHGESYNSLIGRTLFTNKTIRAMRFLYKPRDKVKGTTGELLALVSLGSEVCSHAGVLHGGINTTIFDEVAGGLAARETGYNLMAVNFNVNLRKAVKAPGLVLVKSWIDRPSAGRKVWVKARIEQHGVICTEGEGLWLRVNMESKM